MCKMISIFLFQHSAEATHCDQELTSQLKRAADSATRKLSSHVIGDLPVLMSGAGHDAMAMAKLTKVCNGT
jgi:allantoate deiminase